MGRYDWPRGPRGGDDPGARARHLAQLRPGVNPDTITPLALKKTRGRSRRAAPHNAPSTNQHLWFPIGPTVMTNGQASGNPNVAGRIRDLAIEPLEGRRVYAASAAGGVWFSNDRGNSWRPLDEWQTSSDRNQLGNVATALACGAVHVIWAAPADDGTHDDVWVGTGESGLTTEGHLAVSEGDAGAEQVGSNVLGIGLLNRAAASASWAVVKGADAATDPTTLRGAACYRIAGDPDKPDRLIAATTRGIYLKEPAADWKLTTFPVTGAKQPLDVVMTRSPDLQTVRIWVVSASALSVAEFIGGPSVPIPTALTFATVTLTDVALAPPPTPPAVPPPTPLGSCMQLAAGGGKVYVLGRSTAVPPRTTPPAAVWVVDANAVLGPPVGTPPAVLTVAQLTGTPADLFMSRTDQSAYDMCIAAHPTHAGRIFIGGAVANTGDGAIYRCDTTVTPMTATPIGAGTHADVHVLRVVANPSPATTNSVWTGTDGGVFRSDSEGDAGTFRPANNGLAVLQPGYVSNHPSNPGIVVAGFQDNGTALRIGDGVWQQTFRGDGGGVVFDPTPANNRYYRQYINATWESSDNGGIAPVQRRHPRSVGTDGTTSETREWEASRFYSGPAAALTHGTSATDTHLVIGSTRVWYSRDWGRSWVTLPTATDPRGNDNPDLKQDVLDPVTGGTVKYIDRVGSTDCCATDYPGSGPKGTAVIAMRMSVVPPPSASADLTLRVIALYEGGLVWITGTRPVAATGAFSWTPPPTGLPRQAIKNPTAASDVSLFQNHQPMSFLPAERVVSDFCVHDPGMGALGSCYVTTTGDSFGGTVRDSLWFFDGDATWRPTGLRIPVPPTGPSPWPGNDQVTAPALGVVVDPDDPSVVYVATSVGVVRGKLVITPGTPPTYAWTWEQLMNGLPEAVVQDLAIFTAPGLKLLRAATQARGVWEVDLQNVAAQPLSYLRVYRTDTRRVLPSPTAGDLVIGEPNNVVHWDDSPDIVVDATGVAALNPPSEVELIAVPSPGEATDHCRVSVSTRHLKVHVLAHHRLQDLSLAANQVRIALLRHALPDNGAVPLGGVWGALKAAAAATGQPGPLPDGWSKAAADLWITASDPIDPRLPRALSFDVDLTADAAGSDIVLLAVVMNPSNQITDGDLAFSSSITAQTVDQLVLASPHCAAKTLHIS